MANSDIMCITQKVIFIDKTLLKRQILDMGGITQKTIFYGQNTLKMANSRYGGYKTQNNPLWMKHSENGKFQI